MLRLYHELQIHPRFHLLSRRLWPSVPRTTSWSATPFAGRRSLAQMAATTTAADREVPGSADEARQESLAIAAPNASSAAAAGHALPTKPILSQDELVAQMERALRGENFDNVIALHANMVDAGVPPDVRVMNIVVEAKVRRDGLSQGLELLQAYHLALWRSFMHSS